MDLTKNLVLVLVISVVSGSPLYKTEVHVKSGGTDVIPLGYLDYAPQYQLLMMPDASYGNLPPPCPSPCLVDAVNNGQELPLTSANIRAFHPALAQLALAGRNTGYEYSYLIYNEETGDQKSHHEKKDGSVVRGQYSLKQPDGIIREVHYTAGSDGFNAQVKNIHPNEPCESHGHGVEHGHDEEPHTEEHHIDELSTEAPHLETPHPEEPHIDEHPTDEHGHDHEHEHEHDHEKEHEHPAEIIDIEIKKGDEPHSEDLKVEIKHDEEGTSIKAEELLETTDGPAVEEISVSTEAVFEPILEPIIATTEVALPNPPIFLSLQDIIRCAHKSAAQRGQVQSSPLTYIILGTGGPC